MPQELRLSTIRSLLESEKVKSVKECIELLAVWIACLFGIFLSSTSYAILHFKTKRRTRGAYGSSSSALVSVIISAYNEAANIQHCIEQLVANTKVPNQVEIIIVNASSTDNTEEIAQNMTIDISKKVLTSRSGRGTSMHTGAKAANGNFLLFLHADAIVPFGYDVLIRKELSQTHVIASAFQFKVNRKELDTKLIGLNTMETFANFRAFHFQLPYGDQGIALTSENYTLSGGFPDVKIMEDFELIGTLRRKAVEYGQRITIIPCECECSPRRWIKNGVLKNTLFNQMIVMAYVYLDWSPERIYWYYYG